MESGSKDGQTTIVVAPTQEQLQLLLLAAGVTGVSLEDFVLKAAVTAAESQETTLGQLRKFGKTVLDADSEPDQSA